MPKKNERLVWSERVEAAVKSNGGNISAAARDLNLSKDIVSRAWKDIQEWGIDNTSADRIRDYLSKSHYSESVYEHDTEKVHIQDYKYLPGQELPTGKGKGDEQAHIRYQAIIKTSKRTYSTPIMGTYGGALNSAQAVLSEYEDDDDDIPDDDYEMYIREFDDLEA